MTREEYTCDKSYDQSNENLSHLINEVGYIHQTRPLYVAYKERLQNGKIAELSLGNV